MIPILIPILIPVPTAARIDSRVESIPEQEPDPGLESVPIKEWALINSKSSSGRLNFQ